MEETLILRTGSLDKKSTAQDGDYPTVFDAQKDNWKLVSVFKEPYTCGWTHYVWILTKETQ